MWLGELERIVHFVPDLALFCGLFFSLPCLCFAFNNLPVDSDSERSNELMI